MISVIKSIFTISNNKQLSSRIEILDFLRGAAMILVLLHHAGVPLWYYIQAFHMPFFFLLSGYISCVREDSITKLSIKDYAVKRFIRLMIPYFSFEIINLIIWLIKCAIFKETVSLSYAIINILLCFNTDEYTGLYGRLWFLPCMFVSDLLFWVILKFIKSKYGKVSIVCILFFISWITSHIIPFRLPFTIDIAIMATAFITLGYIGKDFAEYLLSKGNIVVDLTLTVFMGATVYSAYETGLPLMSMFTNDYGNYILTIVAAIGGSISFAIIVKYLYYVFKRIPFLNNLILWQSYNSLVIFPVHLQIKCIALLFGVSFLQQWWVIFTLMLLIDIPIVNIVTNYMPYLIGNLKKSTIKQ